MLRLEHAGMTPRATTEIAENLLMEQYEPLREVLPERPGAIEGGRQIPQKAMMAPWFSRLDGEAFSAGVSQCAEFTDHA